MGEWHKHEPLDSNYPCTNCEMGTCSITSEMRDGELWTKTDDCTENCEILETYRHPLMVDASYVLTAKGYKKRTFI